MEIQVVDDLYKSDNAVTLSFSKNIARWLPLLVDKSSPVTLVFQWKLQYDKNLFYVLVLTSLRTANNYVITRTMKKRFNQFICLDHKSNPRNIQPDHIGFSHPRDLEREIPS